jgi:hypothetical protein
MFVTGVRLSIAEYLQRHPQDLKRGSRGDENVGRKRRVMKMTGSLLKEPKRFLNTPKITTILTKKTYAKSETNCESDRLQDELSRRRSRAKPD